VQQQTAKRINKLGHFRRRDPDPVLHDSHLEVTVVRKMTYTQKASQPATGFAGGRRLSAVPACNIYTQNRYTAQNQKNSIALRLPFK
jgi:hypothetical protein